MSSNQELVENQKNDPAREEVFFLLLKGLSPFILAFLFGAFIVYSQLSERQADVDFYERYKLPELQDSNAFVLSKKNFLDPF